MVLQARIRAAAVLGSALLLVSLAVTTVTLTTSAAPPTCRGEVATMVGTDAAEVIVGTDGPDVIVAKGGADTIRSLGGADIICAGAGDDRVHGGTGRDQIDGGNGGDALKGGKGQDRLRGNAGDDALDGGLHRDACFVGPDGGTRVNCENPIAAPTPAPEPAPDPAPTPTPTPEADLKIEYSGGNSAYPLTFTITVTNDGPAAAAYVLQPMLQDRYGHVPLSCEWRVEPSGPQSSLPSGGSAQFIYEYGCRYWWLGARFTLTIAPLDGAMDPDTSDNSIYLWLPHLPV